MKHLTFMHWSRREVPAVKKIKSGAILLGLAWAFSVTLAASVLMFAWVVLSAGPVYHFSALVNAGSVLGAITGGAAAGRAAGNLGLLHGLLAGSLYGLLLGALFSVGSAAGFSFFDILLRMTALGAAGSLGGLWGVNLQTRRKTYGSSVWNQ